MVAISASVADLAGGSFNDFVLTAKPDQSYFQGNVLIANCNVAFKAVSGAITGFIDETQSTGSYVAFIAHYTADGIYQQIYFDPVIIPDVMSLDLGDLLTVRQ